MVYFDVEILFVSYKGSFNDLFEPKNIVYKSEFFLGFSKFSFSLVKFELNWAF